MKHRLFFFLMACLAFQACKKDRDGVQPVRLTFSVSADDTDAGFTIPVTGTTLLLTNKTNGATYEATANESGSITFESITPGAYDVVASLTISAADYSTLSAVYTDDDVLFNYATTNLSLYEDRNVEIKLVPTGILGNWVFKQIYYSGSNTSQGATFRDAFIEIYNNSNETLYADSLYFAQLTGKANNNSGNYLQENLQYDWNQSLNMNVTGDANKDYVYAKAVFMVPSDGSGKKYPVQPGHSVIIAATAVDHTKPYVNNSGTTVTVGDPTLTVNLNNADFEIYLYPWEQLEQPGRAPFATDIDNPNVADMQTLFSTSQRDMILDATGREAYVIFSVSGSSENPANWPQYATPDVRTITASTTLYPQIPVKFIIDGVQVQHPVAGSRIPWRLPTAIDASATFAPGGQYSSQSIVRKTKQIVNGRRILQDTNNSASDFGHLQKADPSKAASSFVE